MTTCSGSKVFAIFYYSEGVSPILFFSEIAFQFLGAIAVVIVTKKPQYFLV